MEKNYNQDFISLRNEIHEDINRRFSREERRDKIIDTNRILSVLCRGDYGMEPSRCAIIMNNEYGTDFRGNDIIETFNNIMLTNPSQRKEIFKRAEEICSLFYRAMTTGDKQKYAEFTAMIKAFSSREKRSRIYVRLCSIMFYTQYPQIDPEHDFEILETLGNTKSKFFFYDMMDIVESYYNFPSSKSQKNKKKENLTHEQALKKIEKLETSLDRSNAMLSELQTEFDEQLEESKFKEMIDFFALLNSEKYGYILDGLLNANAGINQLARKNYEFPLELNGVRILVKKMVQFVRDNHIEPIMKLNSVQEVNAEQISFCNYEGSPFISQNETKRVRVVSPGWIYKDKEIQISRPTVKEE